MYARLVRDAELPAPWARIAMIAIGVLFVLLMAGFVAGRGVPRAIARVEVLPSTDLKCDVGKPVPGRMQRMLSRVKVSPSAMSATT